MIGIAWNCRGLGQSAVIRHIRRLITSHRPDFLFLSETKSSNVTYLHNLAISFGFVFSEIVPSIGREGGLALMWNDNVLFNIFCFNENVINCILFEEAGIPEWQFTFLYEPPVPGLRPAFWDALTTIGNSFDEPWKLLGDFNALLTQDDKQGGRVVSRSSAGGFRQFINQFGLIDVGFTCYLFTWSNRRSGAASIQERLDRSFANDQWKILFLHATIVYLTTIHSDHKPLLFNSNLNP